MLLKLCVAPQLIYIYVCVCVHFPCTAVFQVWALGYCFLRKGDIHGGTIWGLSLPVYLAFPSSDAGYLLHPSFTCLPPRLVNAAQQQKGCDVKHTAAQTP